MTWANFCNFEHITHLLLFNIHTLVTFSANLLSVGSYKPSLPASATAAFLSKRLTLSPSIVLSYDFDIVLSYDFDIIPHAIICRSLPFQPCFKCYSLKHGRILVITWCSRGLYLMNYSLFSLLCICILWDKGSS